MATALSAFIDEGRSIDIGGDAVMVPAGATVTLSLMLHELATNAAKYGALSVAEGRLAVRWTAAQTGAGITVDLHWQEDGGPPVSPPTRRGFGSRLLASSARQLGAELDLDYAGPGLRCRLRFTVPRLGRSAPEFGPPHRRRCHTLPGHGVVTDNAEHRSRSGGQA